MAGLINFHQRVEQGAAMGELKGGVLSIMRGLVAVSMRRSSKPIHNRFRHIGEVLAGRFHPGGHGPGSQPGLPLFGSVPSVVIDPPVDPTAVPSTDGLSGDALFEWLLDQFRSETGDRKKCGFAIELLPFLYEKAT